MVVYTGNIWWGKILVNHALGHAGKSYWRGKFGK